MSSEAGKGGRGGGGGRRGRSGGRGGRNSRRRGGHRGVNNAKAAATAAPPVLTEEEKQRSQEVRRAAEEAACLEVERRRVEEEQRAAEATRQALLQSQVNLCAQVKEACESLLSTVETTQQHKESRQAFAAEALAKSRKEFEASKKMLKSDLKKCTAFVKKIKSGSAWSMRPEEIQKDVATLNLSRYVEEVASAVCEAKLKVADLPVVVALCSAMHARYPDFLSSIILPHMWSTIHSSKAKEENAKLRRLYLRLVTEFILRGLVTETKPLVKTIKEATGGEDESYVVTDATLLTSFVRVAGFEILGKTPRSIQDNIELLQRESVRAEEVASQPANESGEIQVVIDVALTEKADTAVAQVEGVLGERAVSPAVTDVLSTYCIGAYGFLSKSMVATHTKLQKLEKRCEQDRLVSGSLTDAREKGLSDARKLMESLQKSVETLSDVLVEPMPELEEEEEDGGHEEGLGVEVWTKDGDEDFGPFDDAETRDFYCDIPDLLTTIPPVLLGMTQDDIDRIQAENRIKYGPGSEAVMEEGDASVDVVVSSQADFEATEEAGESKQPKEGEEETGE